MTNEANCYLSLDIDTEKVVYDALDKYFKDTTVIAVVHRLDFIDRFDRVAVFERGGLVGFDRPDVVQAKGLLNGSTGR